MELTLAAVIALIVVAFACEYVDSTLGMGYGTTLTPVLLIAGFSPLQVVPVILLSEFLSGILAGFFHHREGNVDFQPKAGNIAQIVDSLKSLGYIETIRQKFPRHLKVALLLASCSVVGTVFAVYVAVSIPRFWLNLYIGALVFSMGIIILVLMNRDFRFSWKKITCLGLIASFNKGMSGGGYGPVVTGGQILSGMESRSAVGITSLAEGITCLVGILCYLIALEKPFDWELAPFIVAGAVLSVPLSAKSVKSISPKYLKILIGVLTMCLGLLTIGKTVL